MFDDIHKKNVPWFIDLFIFDRGVRIGKNLYIKICNVDIIMNIKKNIYLDLTKNQSSIHGIHMYLVAFNINGL
jgi:hypothetical protein